MFSFIWWSHRAQLLPSLCSLLAKGWHRCTACATARAGIIIAYLYNSEAICRLSTPKRGRKALKNQSESSQLKGDPWHPHWAKFSFAFFLFFSEGDESGAELISINHLADEGVEGSVQQNIHCERMESLCSLNGNCNSVLWSSKWSKVCGRLIPHPREITGSFHQWKMLP